MSANDYMLIGDAVDGYTPAEKAAYDLRVDPLWQGQVRLTEALIRWLDEELA